MSRAFLAHVEAEISFPRVSGDEPVLKNVLESLDRFSPRERG